MSLQYFPSTSSSGGGGGGLSFISTQTASGDTSVIFPLTGGTQSFYFTFNSIEASVTGPTLDFQVSTDGTNYSTTHTSGAFRLFYRTSNSGFGEAPNGQAGDSTAMQPLSETGNLGYGATGNNLSGHLQIFSVADTSVYKQYTARTMTCGLGGGTSEQFESYYDSAGVWQTVSALTHVKFAMSSGTLTGMLTLYGLAES
tara:strand:- start:49 stop:645 length:597 start_codon:yes stop_codon:yes gene_type:complete